MNRKTLQKAIDELSKTDPSLDYVRGMLETLIETIPEDKQSVVNAIVLPSLEVNDEAKALDYMARAKIESVKLLSDESAH